MKNNISILKQIVLLHFGIVHDPCHSILCLNGGECDTTGNCAMCACPPGYTGKVCETGKHIIQVRADNCGPVLWDLEVNLIKTKQSKIKQNAIFS